MRRTVFIGELTVSEWIEKNLKEGQVRIIHSFANSPRHLQRECVRSIQTQYGIEQWAALAVFHCITFAFCDPCQTFEWGGVSVRIYCDPLNEDQKRIAGQIERFIENRGVVE